MKRYLSILLIVSIIVLQIDYTKRQAQAVLPLAAVEIAYIAAAMVAAGATGYVQKDVNGDLYGSLWESAKSIYDDMANDMQYSLKLALATGSFIAMSAVPGLYDYLHGKFMSSDIVPKISGLTAFTDKIGPFAYPDVQSYDMQFVLPSQPATYALLNGSLFETYDGSDHVKYRYRLSCTLTSLGTITNMEIGSGLPTVNSWHSLSSDDWSFVNGVLTIYDIGIKLYSTRISLGVGDYILSSGISQSGYLTTSLDSALLYAGYHMHGTPISNTVDDGDANRPINPPADPTALNMANPDTTYLDRNGVLTTAIPSESVQQETGQIDQDKAALASQASAAAIAAALAAGHSQAAADAAGVAASNAIYLGKTYDEALAAGAAAAIAYVTASTGTLTTDIANTKTGDAIDFSKLKFAASLFTSKFPFSLPWDLKDMIMTFGSGTTVAPVIPIGIGGIETNIEMSRFDSLAAAVRILELFAFGVGLLFSTRKLLGGAS